MSEEPTRRPYAYVQDVTGDWETYTQAAQRLGDTPPDGMIVRFAGTTSVGFRVIEVWESREAWEAFRDDCLRPTMRAVGGDGSDVESSFRDMTVEHAIFNPAKFRQLTRAR